MSEHVFLTNYLLTVLDYHIAVYMFTARWNAFCLPVLFPLKSGRYNALHTYIVSETNSLNYFLDFYIHTYKILTLDNIH